MNSELSSAMNQEESSSTPVSNSNNMIENIDTATPAVSCQPQLLPVISHSEFGICEVWAHNLVDAFTEIRAVVEEYCFVAMTTEFPGTVARPLGDFDSRLDFQYQTLRCNVSLLTLIQSGLTFMNKDGQRPPGNSTWQFNFKFNLSNDMYPEVTRKCLENFGIQIERHETEGVDPLIFAEMLMVSGVVLTKDVKWITYHSAYDFAHLLKILTAEQLPNGNVEFLQILRQYFPNICDLKYWMQPLMQLRGDFLDIARHFELLRQGFKYRAGTLSLLIGVYMSSSMKIQTFCSHCKSFTAVMLFSVLPLNS